MNGCLIQPERLCLSFPFVRFHIMPRCPYDVTNGPPLYVDNWSPTNGPSMMPWEMDHVRNKAFSMCLWVTICSLVYSIQHRTEQCDSTTQQWPFQYFNVHLHNFLYIFPIRILHCKYLHISQPSLLGTTQWQMIPWSIHDGSDHLQPHMGCA